MDVQQGFLQQREADLKGRRQLGALNEIEANFDNIRAAWKQAVIRKNYAAVDAMIDGIYSFCVMQGRFHDAEEFFHLAQDQLAPSSGEFPHPVWYRVQARWPRGNITETLKQALEFARQHNNSSEVAYCLSRLGDQFTWDGDAASGIAYYEESLTYYRKTDDKFQIASILRSMGFAQASLGDIEGYSRRYEQSLVLQREIGDRMGEAMTLSGLGLVSLSMGRYQQAEPYGEQALAILGEMGKRHGWAQGDAVLAVAVPNLLKLNPDLARVKSMAEQALSVAKDYQHATNIGRALLVLGYVAAIEGDYAKARELAEEGQRQMPYEPMQIVLGNYLLAYITCNLEDYPAASTYLSASLQLLTRLKITEPIKRLVPPAAVILKHAGRSERAVEILGFAFSDASPDTEGQRQLPFFTRLQATLKSELGEAVYEAAWERGKTLDTLELAEAILAENQ